MVRCRVACWLSSIFNSVGVRCLQATLSHVLHFLYAHSVVTRPAWLDMLPLKGCLHRLHVLRWLNEDIAKDCVNSIATYAVNRRNSITW